MRLFEILFGIITLIQLFCDVIYVRENNDLEQGWQSDQKRVEAQVQQKPC